MECEVKFKRKKTEHTCPNPLFEKWITEWRDEAAQKQWKTKYVYDKALQSLKKYPLPLKSGKEAKLLEYFGDKICNMLDEKLAKHRLQQGVNVVGCQGSESANLDDDNSTVKCHSSSDSGNNSSRSEIPKESTVTTLQNGRKHYVPAYRSGAYALLVTLYKYQLMDGYVGNLRKTELMTAAQPLCDKSFTIPDAGSYYTTWSSMGLLIKKGLILKEGNPARYILTASGVELVARILRGEEKQRCENTGSSSTGPSSVSGSTASSQQSTDSCAYLAMALNFKLERDQFEIVLCVDNCETVPGTINERKQAVQTELKKNGVNFDIRKLNVGDFVWIAREKVKPIPGRLHLPPARELVLDYIVERKRKDDLAGSIRDGRYKEQKFRLKSCGLRCPIYLIEDFGCKNTFSIPDAALFQAISNTQIVDGFTIKHTKDIFESVAYLTVMTRYLQSFYSNKVLWSCTRGEVDYSRKGEIQDDELHLMTFEEFNTNSVKNKSLTVTELFAKQLLKVYGLSVDKVRGIINLFPTPACLLNSYNACETEKDKENLIAEITFGKCGRKIGPALSKALYFLYNRDDVH